MKRSPSIILMSAALAAPFFAALTGQEPRFNDTLFERLTWRNLGPFRTGAWTTAIAVPETPAKAHLYTFAVDR